MIRLAFGIYAACVDFMIRASHLTHSTYRDANAFMFFVLWPLVTILLLCVVMGQAWKLRRFRRNLRRNPD
jgi:hypothetical protein